MKIYNLTGSTISILVGPSKKREIVKNLEVSPVLVATPGLIKGSILPLINMFGSKLILVLNSSDQLVLDAPGCLVPAENIMDEGQANKVLNQAKNAVKNANKPQPKPNPEPKPDPKPEPVKVEEPDPEKKKVEEEPGDQTNPNPEKSAGTPRPAPIPEIKVTRIPGKDSQEKK